MREPLLITCPDCGLVIDATRIARGTEFSCSKCSKRLPVPSGIAPPPPTFASRANSIFGACALLGCVSFATLMASPNFAAENRRQHRGAALRLVRALCWSEVMRHVEGQPWIPIEPIPASVPTKAVPFPPSAELASLEFSPKTTAFQFSVRINGTAGVICEARNAGMSEAITAQTAGNTLEDRN